jgi:predicted AAA+ superfamily ATPase
MRKILRRRLSINLPQGRSAFLWGPRKTGKSFWVRQTFPDCPLIDLLKTDVFAEYASRPALLRERFTGHEGIVVVDEIQMVPSLLNEIHWLIENAGVQFLLTGSSARKLRRSHANLLGGRAWRFSMRPLTFGETEGFDIERAMISGLLPPHFLSPDPLSDLRAYVADYLKEEIAEEARVQNIPAFVEFLRVAAVTSCEQLNHTNVARESGVSAKVVRNYFQILDDTLLGTRLLPWTRSRGRRMVETEKFYLFDVGLANFLARRQPQLGTPEFGKSFEHYILMELLAYQAYRAPDLPLHYWRTSSGLEVDFVAGDMDVALEVKASARVHDGDLRGLRALLGEHHAKHALVVSMETEVRTTHDGIRILPWQQFLATLWDGGLGI